LNVSVFNTIVYLDGATVTNNNIDAIELKLSKEQPNKKVFIYKPKGASYYINNNGI
jgi:hypothetical protein